MIEKAFDLLKKKKKVFLCLRIMYETLVSICVTTLQSIVINKMQIEFGIVLLVGKSKYFIY